jgi:hypothetical protein
MVMSATSMIILGMLLAAGVATELCAVLMAPLGYENEKGFHQGLPGAEEADAGQPANPS